MSLTDYEKRLAKMAAQKFLPTKLEDVRPPAPPKKKRPHVVGVYKHGQRWRANIKQPNGTWRQTSFETFEEAARVRTESLSIQNP